MDRPTPRTILTGPARTRPRAAARLEVAAAFLLFFAAALGWQFRQGAYAAEFASNPDEPSHLVTGLMVRDYLAHGLRQNPLSYAREYYAHYPKVAMGHWPPLFYLEQAVWMLVFSRSGWAVLVLMAVLCGISATLLFAILRPRHGPWAACLAGLVFVSLPVIQIYTGELMTEIPVILFTSAATCLFGCYLAAGNARTEWKYALWFGLAASGAIMTKGSGFVLALLPLCGVLPGRRRDLPRRLSFYAPAALVIVLCLPWYLLAPDARHESVDPFGGPHPSLRAFLIAPVLMFGTAGPLLAPLALLGFALAWRKGAGDTQAQAAAAMLSSLALFRGFLEVARDARVLTIAIPPMILLAASGLAWLLSLPRARFRSWQKTATACVLASAVILWSGWSVPRKPRLGYRSLVNELRRRPAGNQPVTLIVADAAGEGAFVSEIALRDPAVTHRVIRGSKFLSQSDWSGSWRRPLFHDTASLIAAIRAAHIGLVVVDLVAMERDPQFPAARDLVQASLSPSFGKSVPLAKMPELNNPAARRFVVFAVQ